MYVKWKYVKPPQNDTAKVACVCQDRAATSQDIAATTATPASGEERQSAESSESDNEPDSEQGLSLNPWPYLNSLFEFDRVKNEGTDKPQTFIFKCLLCLLKQKYLSAFNNSTSNSQKQELKILKLI